MLFRSEVAHDGRITTHVASIAVHPISEAGTARDKPKYEVRVRNRCRACGRPRGVLRKFALCRSAAHRQGQKSDQILGETPFDARPAAIGERASLPVDQRIRRGGCFEILGACHAEFLELRLQIGTGEQGDLRSAIGIEPTWS